MSDNNDHTITAELDKQASEEHRLRFERINFPGDSMHQGKKEN